MAEEVLKYASSDADIEDVLLLVQDSGSQYKSSQPITIITADDIRVQGYTNAASAVFDLPSVFASASTAGIKALSCWTKDC